MTEFKVFEFEDLDTVYEWEKNINNNLNDK